LSAWYVRDGAPGTKLRICNGALNGDGGVSLRRQRDGEEIPGGAVLEHLKILCVVFAGGEWLSGVGADDVK
jgi:hypothetical protein